MKLTNLVTTAALLATTARAAPTVDDKTPAVDVEAPATLAFGDDKTTTVDIPWDKVFRTLISMVECEKLITKYQWDYFPSSVFCLPIPGGAVLVVIEL